MLSEADAACYPVCDKCRVAGVCATPKLPPVKVPKPARVKNPNEVALALAKCGCRLVPLPILVIAKKENVICDKHGITRIVKEKKKAKPEDNRNGKLDIPPF